MCHVSNQTVLRIVESLGQSPSETRPTLRRYIDKHGNVSWMETAKINEPDEPDDDQPELDLEIPSKEVLEYLKEFQFYRAPTSRSNQFFSSGGGMSARFSSFSADKRSRSFVFSVVAISSCASAFSS